MIILSLVSHIQESWVTWVIAYAVFGFFFFFFFFFRLMMEGFYLGLSWIGIWWLWIISQWLDMLFVISWPGHVWLVIRIYGLYMIITTCLLYHFWGAKLFYCLQCYGIERCDLDSFAWENIAFFYFYFLIAGSILKFDTCTSEW